MVIPPVLSVADQKQSPVPALLIGGSAFCAHIGIRVWRKEEVLSFGLLKIAFFAAFVVAVNIRVFMS
jgi:hypothetical protein